ncbi:MAG: MBL fold metallo-hydrolase, partial [Fimbriimonadaceae bacterium]
MIEFLALASSSAGNCFQQIKEGMGFTVSSLAGCLVSHGHGDHAMSVSHLMSAGIPVYASPETFQHLHLEHHHRAKPLHPEAPVLVGEWTVQAFEAVHDMPGTLGFVIASPNGGKLLYLTDSAYSRYRF